MPAPVGHRDQRQLTAQSLEPPHQPGLRVGDREGTVADSLQPPSRPGDRQPGRRHGPVLSGAAGPGQDPAVREHADDPVRGDLQALVEAGGPRRPEPPSRPPRGPVGPADDQGQNPGQRHVVLEQQHVPGGHVDRIGSLRDVCRRSCRHGRISGTIPRPAGPVEERGGVGALLVGVGRSRPRREPDPVGQRLGVLRQVGEPVAHRSGQPRRPRTSRQRREPASVRHQRPAVTDLTDRLRNRDVLTVQPRTAMPRSTRNLPAIGHLQQRSPILRITAVQWCRVQRGFLTFSERAVALAPRNGIPGPGRRRR